MAILTQEQYDGIRKNQEPYKFLDDVTYSPVRGLLAVDGYKTTDDILLFQFNPSVINDVKNVEWANYSSTGFSSNDYLWVKGGERQFTFKLWFDATAETNNPTFRKDSAWGNATVDTLLDVYPRGVMPMVEKLTAFQYPMVLDSDSPRYANSIKVPETRFMPPPVAIFIFGEFYMRAIVSNVSVQYSTFNKRLTAQRAECDVTLKVIETDIVKVDDYLLARSRQMMETEQKIGALNSRPLPITTNKVTDLGLSART